jgi:hypothetical protein
MDSSSSGGSTTQTINVNGYFYLNSGDTVQGQIYVFSGSSNYGPFQIDIVQIT